VVTLAFVLSSSAKELESNKTADLGTERTVLKHASQLAIPETQ